MYVVHSKYHAQIKEQYRSCTGLLRAISLLQKLIDVDFSINPKISKYPIERQIIHVSKNQLIQYQSASTFFVQIRFKIQRQYPLKD